MTADNNAERRAHPAGPEQVPGRPWWGVVLRDEHFWIPLAVLVAGLVILRWIA